MPPGDETASPPATVERRVLDHVAAILAGENPVVDAASLAGDPPDAGALVSALRDGVGDGAVILCAGVLERMADFLAVVETLVAVAADRDATVIVKVPNDAVAEGDERGASAWGDGAVAELRGLLPADHVTFHLLALRGAALVAADDAADIGPTTVVEADATAPAAFVLAFGPRAESLATAALITPADLSAERAFNRARTAELEVLRARLRSLEQRPEFAPANGGQ